MWGAGERAGAKYDVEALAMVVLSIHLLRSCAWLGLNGDYMGASTVKDTEAEGDIIVTSQSNVAQLWI